LKVLITGASGFFGCGFVAKLLYGNLASRICVYSRDEAKHAAMRAEIGADERMRYFIGDVRDRERLARAMNGCDTVVHAAALKRIEVGHYDTADMVKTNVMGSINVAECAEDSGIKNVVLLSTDKAYQPISPYGYSKAIAERIFLSAGFKVTRYGNVAGSTGSIIPVWRQAIKEGREITVTDPDCTRFYMTLQQAVDLVLESLRGDKQLMIPDLPAYRVDDLRRAMSCGMYKVTGLPAWEKKHESMCEDGSSETARRMTVEELREALKIL